MKSIVKSYNESKITFDMLTSDVMVNATEMAKPFGKEPYDYLKNPGTKEFINSLIAHFNSENISELKTEITEDFLVQTKTGRYSSGTWMHRYLAIDFAAWLDPKFRVWMIITVDEILTKLFKEAIKNIQEKSDLEKQLGLAKVQAFNEENNLAIKIIELQEAKKKKSSEGRKIYGTLKMNFASSDEE